MSGNRVKFYNELLEEDLSHILNHTKDVWDAFKDKTIFITGGTGFFGKWFLETFAYANYKLDLNFRIIVLSRNPEKFLDEFVYIKNNPIFKFIKGDVRNFDFPNEQIDYIIHAATEASAKLNNEDPLLMLDTIVEGTRIALELAKEKKVKSFLFISSGAVYGKQPSEIAHISEEYNGAPNCLEQDSAYGEGKRVGELLSAIYFRQYHIPVKIARCFAFIGPYLPLDAHFAIGNFILNVLQGKDIIIEGDGTPYRSYLYTADLMIWLLTIILQGKNNVAYNVGSDEDVSIKELATTIANCFENKIEIKIATASEATKNIERYVPSVSRIKQELQVDVNFDLVSCINKTIKYYSSKKSV
ncbi:MAG: dTDP-glucose 4 6-dehydratase [Ignavibacteria bacterium]|nr:MAG: dTDP-glucose 4 6-dehydratase [Ignavibacteria bacterium]KAF0158538.1 MAG: dTDP-glucose 4 6-dehydratase [Ignavibacteria bacterium]